MAEHASQEPSWYAVAVRARCEKSVAQTLADFHIELFLPTVTERRPWSDRIKRVELALFPGYLFVRCVLSPELRYKILDARDVFALVGHSAQRMAIAIPNAEIEAVQRIVAYAEQVEACETLPVGSRVRVIRGPMRGIEGTVSRGVDGKHRLYCAIQLLGRAVQTRINEDDLLAID